MEQILELDYRLFYWINSRLNNGFLDSIMPIWRSKSFWLPLYVFLIYLLYNIFRNRMMYVVFSIVLLVGISDGMSSHLIKKNIKRTRPCNTEIIKDNMHLLVPCGSGYSFTSSHATNHFSLAMYLFVLLSPGYRLVRWALLFWAASIAFGQVYVGVHFPIDVLAGSLLGILIGWFVGRWTKKLTIRG